jgi:hypothetical protein
MNFEFLVVSILYDRVVAAASRGTRSSAAGPQAWSKQRYSGRACVSSV